MMGIGITLTAKGSVGAVLTAEPNVPSLALSCLVEAKTRTAEGLLIDSTTTVWLQIIQALQSDWSQAYQLPAEKWEEIIAGGFKEWGCDEVILTPRSGDHGRDVIGIKHGFGSVKILGSVKAYKPGHLVDYDAIRALAGVVSYDHSASKGILTTTSDFPPLVAQDPIAALIPTRLELINGTELRKWLADLARNKTLAAGNEQLLPLIP